jgi:hypothetical protein
MDDVYDSDEVRHLRLRVLELEEENEKLRAEASRYLGKWVAAQDLASWRQVLMLAGNPEKTSAEPET